MLFETLYGKFKWLSCVLSWDHSLSSFKQKLIKSWKTCQLWTNSRITSLSTVPPTWLQKRGLTIIGSCMQSLTCATRKPSPEKLQLKRHGTIFMENKLAAAELLPDYYKARAIQNMPKPMDCAHILHLLGMTTY